MGVSMVSEERKVRVVGEPTTSAPCSLLAVDFLPGLVGLATGKTFGCSNNLSLVIKFDLSFYFDKSKIKINPKLCK